MQDLLNGNSYPGIINDDTQVFPAAKKMRLKVLTFDVILPNPSFRDSEKRLNTERGKSQYRYGFPGCDR
jgi:hypothetical protein